MDFCFTGKENDPHNTQAVLVAKEERSKMKLSAAVPSKSTGAYIARRIMGWMKEIGIETGDMIMKSDQEAAITSIVREVGKMRAANGGGKHIIEESLVGSSKSNGFVEGAILSVEQMVRTIRTALSRRWRMKIPTKHPIMPWIMEWASYLLNRYEVARDGKTAYERCKGKKSKAPGIEFGEAILWKKKKSSGAMGKLDCTWEEGVFLGIRGRSGEMIIGDGEGVKKTRNIRRRPTGERWNNRWAQEYRGGPATTTPSPTARRSRSSGLTSRTRRTGRTS